MGAESSSIYCKQIKEYVFNWDNIVKEYFFEYLLEFL